MLNYCSMKNRVVAVSSELYKFACCRQIQVLVEALSVLYFATKAAAKQNKNKTDNE